MDVPFHGIILVLVPVASSFCNVWIFVGACVQCLDKEESGALLAPYEKVKAWMVAVEEFTAPYFVEVHGGLEKFAKILEDKRKSEAEAEAETAPKL